MAELWGKNSATDNPPRPMILIPAHTPSAHASSGFRPQVSFRAVFGWAATVMPSLSYQCAGPLYVERINVSVQASLRGTTRFYAATPLPPRHPSLLPTPNAYRSTHHPSHPNAGPYHTSWNGLPSAALACWITRSNPCSDTRCWSSGRCWEMTESRHRVVRSCRSTPASTRRCRLSHTRPLTVAAHPVTSGMCRGRALMSSPTQSGVLSGRSRSRPIRAGL